MPAVRKDEILGYQTEEKVYCSEKCFHDDGNSGLTEENIILEDQQDEEVMHYFCDFCGEAF